MHCIGLDVGEKRIGVARGNAVLRLAYPLQTIDAAQGDALEIIMRIIKDEGAQKIVVGMPRNMQGEKTKQSQETEKFIERLKKHAEGVLPAVVFQDESLTSVVAKQRLDDRGGAYEKADVDKEAAAIILQDYLEKGA